MDDKGNSPTFPHLKGLQAGDVASSCIKQVRLLIQLSKCPSATVSQHASLIAFFMQ